MPDEQGIEGLLRKGCIKASAVKVDDGVIYYSLTSFGSSLLAAADKLLDKVPIATPEPGHQEPGVSNRGHR